MKRKAISALLCATMVAAMVAGCGNKSAETAAATEAPKETTAATEAPAETEAPADTTEAPAETTEAPADDANAGSGDYSDVTIEIVAKGFQHDFWKAVKLGTEQAAADLGLAGTNFVGPQNESAVAEQVEQLNNAINKNRARSASQLLIRIP